MQDERKKFQKPALYLIILLGLVSMFADITYEGARSIMGPFLGSLGASAAVVGFVAGLGEFIGYSLRLVSGYWLEKTTRYWPMTLFGYFCNLLAVPLLALVTTWPVATVLLVIGRIGKAVRIPARDSMLSYAGHRVGVGKGFGLHQTFDRVGAMLGPFLISMLFVAKENYRQAFATMFIPAFCALLFLLWARKKFPAPQDLEIEDPEAKEQKINGNRSFWWFTAACAFIALGYADFPLVAFHFAKQHILSDSMIPFSYGLAMASTMVTVFWLGRLYDINGRRVLAIILSITSMFAPLVFLGGKYMALSGMVLWGIGIGVQSALFKAVVGKIVPKRRRAFAYGIFNAIYGLSWLLGSSTLGFLYEFSIPAVVILSVTAQLIFIPVMITGWRIDHKLSR